jgi:4-amino-4-deoxy-L-arabinose transferase-like glycosyltransferase
VEFSIRRPAGTLSGVALYRETIIPTVWRHRRLICALLALSLYSIGLGRPALWEPDEGRYAEIAREMVVENDYLTPRNNFVRYFEKPPLVYWVTAACIRVFGHNEFAVRLQAAVASAGQVAITEALGERMFGASTGVLGALALALSPLFFSFARFATPDPMLALFITAAMACFYAGAECSPINGIWMLAMTALLALGTLTKGPVALLLGSGIAILWLTVEGRGYQIFHVRWLGCIALYAGITLPWFIVVARSNPGFLQFFIFHEHFQRYLESTEHGWGPWFYVPITIAGTWPWVYFVPLALRQTVYPFAPAGKGAIAGPVDATFSQDGRVAAALRFLLIWFVVVLVFFSIPRSKLGEYILPGLPPIAILAGLGLTTIARLTGTRRQRWFTGFAALNGVAAIAVVIGTLLLPTHGFGQALAPDAIVLAIALLAAGVVPLLLASHDAIVAPAALTVSMLIIMGAGIHARERVAPLVSYRGLAESIAPYTKRGCRLMSYRHFEQALPFYTGARETLVNYRGELEPFGPQRDPSGEVFATTSQLSDNWAADGCIVLVANRADLATLDNLLHPTPTLIGCEGKKLAFCNRAVLQSAQAKCVNPSVKSPW